jgi:hypothetical protein
MNELIILELHRCAYAEHAMEAGDVLDVTWRYARRESG